MQNCWICNSEADSREHKIKRSDLIRIHGKDSAFREAQLNYLKHTGDLVVLQGPDSRHVKFDKVICSKCNNELTQPFDAAYDSFIEYIEANQHALLRQRYIDLQDVYGSGWEVSQLSLFRYFAKALGCRIADAGKEVPTDLREMLFTAPFQTFLWICMAVNEDEVSQPLAQQTTLRIGNIITNVPNLSFPKYTYSCWYKWLLISFWYGWGPFGPVGSRWCADSQYLYLGSYSERQARPIVSNGKNEFEWPAL